MPPPDGADELRRVPDLAGPALAVPAAVAALEALGLTAVLVDDGGRRVEEPDEDAVVTSQDPAASSILRLEDEVTLTIGPGS